MHAISESMHRSHVASQISHAYLTYNSIVYAAIACYPKIVFIRTMPLELRHLDLVRAAVEEGGLTRAGRRLGLSQSALSHQLRAVEEQFGVTLFHRTGRRLVLAPAGERILRTARLVIPEMERTEMELQEDSNQLHGTIRLAVECFSCYQWLPGILSRFVRKNTAVDLRIVTGTADKPVEALLRNDLDIAIVSQPARDRRLKIVELFEDELVAVTAAGHPLAGKPYLRPKDFSGETLYSYPSLASSLVYQRMLRTAGLRPKEVSEIPLAEAILQLVKNGFGLAVLAHWIVQPYLADGQYLSFAITARGLRRKWCAVIRNSKESPEHLAALLQALRHQSLTAIGQVD
jgi:LysR family transcriptional regulator, regulator for metE and metH